MNLSIIQHNASFATSPQIQTNDVAAIAKQGYKTIINLRPDGEADVSQQPLSADLAKAAEAAKVHYYHLPVVRGQYSPEQIEKMAKILAKTSKPILGFCGSGMRASEMYALGTAYNAKHEKDDKHDKNDKHDKHDKNDKHEKNEKSNKDK